MIFEQKLIVCKLLVYHLVHRCWGSVRFYEDFWCLQSSIFVEDSQPGTEKFYGYPRNLILNDHVNVNTIHRCLHFCRIFAINSLHVTFREYVERKKCFIFIFPKSSAIKTSWLTVIVVQNRICYIIFPPLYIYILFYDASSIFWHKNLPFHLFLRRTVIWDSNSMTVCVKPSIMVSFAVVGLSLDWIQKQTNAGFNVQFALLWKITDYELFPHNIISQ